MARRAKPTPKRLAAFLDDLSHNGNVTLSAEAHNLERARLYEIRKEDEAFAAAWNAAMDVAADRLEAEARRRALEGLLQKKFTPKGAPIIDPETGIQYAERVYSDTLLIFLLKGARPDVYRERQSLEHSGPDGAPLPAAQVLMYIPSNGRDDVEIETASPEDLVS